MTGDQARRVLDVGMGYGLQGQRTFHPALSAHDQWGETARLLAHTEVFGDLEERELEEVAQVAVPRHWDRGEVIFREGDQGDTCYLLRSGAVVLTREHQDGRMVALAELRAGALFGELAMFRGETRSATAEAIEATTAVALLASDMQRLIRRSPGLALKFLGRSPSASRRPTSGCSNSPSRPSPAEWRAPCSPRSSPARRRRAPGGRADPLHTGRDREPGRHLAGERQPLPGHARARRVWSPWAEAR